MERSNYENFMDCYQRYENFTRTLLTLVVALEYCGKHRASGTPFTEADDEEALREIERRLALERPVLYAHALREWVTQSYEQSEETADQ